MPTHCAFCKESPRKGKKKFHLCSQCRSVSYCTPSCQRNHWKEHKITCTNFAKIMSQHVDKDKALMDTIGKYFKSIAVQKMVSPGGVFGEMVSIQSDAVSKFSCNYR